MKAKLFIIALIHFSHIHCFGIEITDKPKFDKTTERAFKQQKQTDIVIDYLVHENKFDIGIGKVTNGARYPKVFTFDDIAPFLKNQKHKNLIVVIFSKNTTTEKENKEYAKVISLQLKKIGYKKVVVQQGYAFGRGIWHED